MGRKLEIHTQLPRLKIDMNRIMKAADNHKELQTSTSEVSGQALIWDTERVIVVTGRKGYIVLNYNDIDATIEELENAKDFMEYNRKIKKFEEEHPDFAEDFIANGKSC